MRPTGTILRQKMLGTVLLLSVLIFSFSTSAHWLWHGAELDSCRDTAHSCCNETLGNHQTAWQLPVHPPVNFSGHHLQCPVCSGLLGIAETPPALMPFDVAPATVGTDFVAENAPQRFELTRAARGPPSQTGGSANRAELSFC